MPTKTDRKMDRPNPLLEPILAPEEEMEASKKLAQLLKKERSPLMLVGEDGKTAPIPESLRLIIQEVARVMASGRAIQLQQFEKELTIHETAELLHVPLKFLNELLESGELPHHKVDSYPRIWFEDAIAYKQKRRIERQQGLRELTQLSQEWGLYDDGVFETRS